MTHDELLAMRRARSAAWGLASIGLMAGTIAGALLGIWECAAFVGAFLGLAWVRVEWTAARVDETHERQMREYAAHLQALEAASRR